MSQYNTRAFGAALEVSENIRSAHDDMTIIGENLRHALSFATPLQALVLLPLIERAAILERDFAALNNAIVESES